MQAEDGDLYALQRLLSVNQIKTSAYYFNAKRHVLALVSGTGGIIIYANLEAHPKPLLRWIPWFEDRDKTIQSICFQQSFGAWMAVVCYDGSLYILPITWLVDFEIIGSVPTIEWMANDVTYFPSPTKDFIPTSISWWETKISAPGNFAVIGGKSGKIQLRDLSNGHLVGQTSVSGDISSVAVFAEDINVISVLVTNEQNEQWKLVLESQDYVNTTHWWNGGISSKNLIEDQFAQRPVFPSARVRLQGLKQLSVETMASIRQKISENKSRSVANSLRRKDSSSSSSSDDFAVKFRSVPSKIENEVWYVSPGYSRSQLISEPVYHIYNIPGNFFKIKKPKHSYKLPPEDMTSVGLSIYTDFFLFIANTSATQINILSTKLLESDRSQEYNLQSFVQKVQLEDDERIQALYRMSCFNCVEKKRPFSPVIFTKSLPISTKDFLPSINLSSSNQTSDTTSNPVITPAAFETCLIISNKSVYILNLKNHPSDSALKLLDSDESLEKVEWITKIFSLDRPNVLLSAANVQLAAGNWDRAINFLKLAKTSPLEIALRLASAGLVKELITFVTSLTHLELSPPERRRLAEICILAFVEQILRAHDKSKYLKKFLKLLSEDLYYRECHAVQTVGKCFLFPVLKYFLCERGLIEDVADVIESIISENSVKFLELHDGFWDVVTDRSLADILIHKKSFALEYMKLIQTNLLHLPVPTLQSIYEFFNPTRSCIRPLVKTMFNFVKSNQQPREILNQSKFVFSTDIGVEVNYPIENWITIFLLTLLQLLHKTQSTSYSFDALNFVCLKHNSPSKGMLIKLSNKVVLSAGLAHGAAILKKTVFTWGQDRHSCLGRRPAMIVAQADPIPWFAFPKIDVHSIACGRYHTLALTSNGVYSWGLSNYGQLGVGGLKNSPIPRIVETLSEESIISVAAGQYHSLAISANGLLWTWGWGVHGQLGHGSIEDVLVPTVVSCLSCEFIVQAAGGYAHSIALSAKGCVIVFGSSYFGQLGIGSPVKRTTPIEVYGLSEPITQISSGYFHNLALSKAGRLYIWGSSPQVLRSQTQAQKRSKAFQLKSSFKPEDDEFASKFTCDDSSTNNTESSCKGDFFSETFGSVPTPEPKAQQLDFPTLDSSASPDESAIHLSPMLVDTSNVLGKIIAISCGCHHSVILDEKGTVYTWGKNFDGQLGDGTRKAVLLPSPIQINNQLKLSSDNLILHVPLSTVPIQYICCGADFTLAMESGGRIWGWGSNQSGQLGTPPVPDDSDIRIKIKASSKRVLKVPYGSQNNIIDSPQLVPIVAYQHFPTFPENKLSTSVYCSIHLPSEIIQHNLVPLAKIDPSPSVLSLHYILECFHNCYNVDLVKSVCTELENFQALAKIHHLNKNYCQAFMNHLKSLLSTNLDFFVSVGVNSRNTIRSARKKEKLVSLEVIAPNLTTDMIVKSKSENFINSQRMMSSEKMNVSEIKETSVVNGGNMKMETSDNRTWIQSDDTLEEQSSIITMTNSDIYRSDNMSYNHIEEVKKNPPNTCDNECYQASSPDSLSFENKERLSICDEIEIHTNSYFLKPLDADKRSQLDKSESFSVDILDCVSNEDYCETTNAKLESDCNDCIYKEDSLNRFNILNSLNSEIKDILLGAAKESNTDISLEPVNQNGLDTTFETEPEDEKLAVKALEIFQLYLDLMKKASKTDCLYFLHESILTWISHQLPVHYLENLFDSQWDDYVNYLGIILICGIRRDSDHGSTQQMLHQFSLKFNLRVCATLIESASDKET
nr:PREDICTED: uncharacterized protein LOC109040440 isoform X2 [Bemisia tabaci]